MMAEWQDHLSDHDDTDNLEQTSISEPNINTVGELKKGSPSSLAGTHLIQDAPGELAGFDTASDQPQEEPNISPGDIVYISRYTGDQLLYKKAVYLGDSGSGQHIARDWSTYNDLKVSLSEIVRKRSVREDEKIEAESIKSYVAIQDAETMSKSRFYLKHATVPPEIKSRFTARVNKLAMGDEWLSGYDRAMVQKACSTFMLRFQSQLSDRNVRVEELLRMFYASAVLDLTKDATLSDKAQKAGRKRHAALLTDMLIRTIDEAPEQIFPEKHIVSGQLREEQAGMIARMNRAVRDSKDQSSATSSEHAESTHEDRLKEAEMSPKFLEALKSRLAVVIKGEEKTVTLPKFGAHLLIQTCVSFLQTLPPSPVGFAIPLTVMLSRFY